VRVQAASTDNWVVLSSGPPGAITESWSVSGTAVRNLPSFNPLSALPPLSSHEASSLALAHLKKKYPADSFVVSTISLERFIPPDQQSPDTEFKDWIYVIYFTYNKEGHAQAVPVLLDGTVILSNAERK